MRKISLLICIALGAMMLSAVSCSNKAEESPMGGYSFGEIYLHVDGSLVNLHELEIILPNEEGFTDLEVMTGKLESAKRLKGDESISVELFSEPLDGAIDNQWSYRQKIRVKHKANQGTASRSCTYRIFADVADGVAADVTFRQKGR